MQKRLLWSIICVLLTGGSAAAQRTPFIPNTFNTDSAESLYQFCETGMHRYLFAGERAHPDSSGFIVLTDNVGNVIRYRFLTTKAEVVFTWLRCNDDATLSAYGFARLHSDSSYRFFYCRFDTTLHIIAKKENELIDSTIDKIGGINLNMASVFSGGSLYSDLFYDTRNPDTPSITSFGTKSVKHTVDMDTVFTQKGKWLINIGAGAAPGTLIGISNPTFYRLDTNFKVLDSMELIDRNPGVPFSFDDSVNGRTGARITSVECSPNRFFSGIRFFSGALNNFAWGGTLYDLSAKKIVRKSCFPFHTDYVSPQSAPLDPIVLHKNKIYYTGYYYPMGYFSDSIIVARHDTSGKTEWIKKYCSSSSVTVMSQAIFGVSDGLIVLATKDTLNSLGNVQQDLFILKIDENGEPLGIKSLSAQLHRPQLLLFPNPATETISIDIGAAQAFSLSIWNSLGQMVKQIARPGARTVVGISDLPPGSYRCVLTNDQGLTEASEHFIKQ